MNHVRRGIHHAHRQVAEAIQRLEKGAEAAFDASVPHSDEAQFNNGARYAYQDLGVQLVRLTEGAEKYLERYNQETAEHQAFSLHPPAIAAAKAIDGLAAKIEAELARVKRPPEDEWMIKQHTKLQVLRDIANGLRQGVPK